MRGACNKGGTCSGCGNAYHGMGDVCGVGTCMISRQAASPRVSGQSIPPCISMRHDPPIVNRHPIISPIGLRSGRLVADAEETVAEATPERRRMRSPPPPSPQRSSADHQGGHREEGGEAALAGPPLRFGWKIDPRLRTEEQREAMRASRRPHETEPMQTEGDEPVTGDEDPTGSPDAEVDAEEESDEEAPWRQAEEQDPDDGPTGPSFAFARPGPGAKPVTDLQEAIRKRKKRHARLPKVPEHPLPAWNEECAEYLQENWDGEYKKCPQFSRVWEDVHAPDKDWPAGYRLHEGKLLHAGRLCVPWQRVMGTIQAHHMWNAHQGPERLIPELELHYEFPSTVDIRGSVAHVRKHCLVCQACLAPNWSMKTTLEMTPIPPRAWYSVSLDVFHMPEVTWQGRCYNGYLMCVDRHSGWMVARPADVRGAEEEFTGEKAAHLLLDGSWGELGVPSVVTCDLGAQFISQWWETMCSRLGVRQAFSQGHHHQANGRAEVAGRVLQDILQRMFAQTGVNWVEALPRALRIHHDSVDPVSGLRPYQVMFGRLRSMAGLPWSLGELETTAEYFSRMEDIDRLVAERRNQAHQEQADRVNAHRRVRPPYQVGDYVFLQRPKGVGGVKLETRWTGPYPVVERVGRNSYRLKVSTGMPVDAHASQLKFCWWEEKGEHILDMSIPPREGDIVDRHPKVRTRENHAEVSPEG